MKLKLLRLKQTERGEHRLVVKRAEIKTKQIDFNYHTIQMPPYLNINIEKTCVRHEIGKQQTKPPKKYQKQMRDNN